MFTTLVSAAELFARHEEADWVVFDCRFMLTETEYGRAAYGQAHIPGARYVHLDEDMSSAITPSTGRHPLPDVQVLVEKLSAWGVDASKQIVVYDDAFGAIAGRLWWLLRWLGHTQVALLDGGLPAWQREKYPMQSELPVITPATFVAQVNNEMLVDAGFVQANMEKDDFVLVDARAEERFLGQVEPLDKVAGHIPGAINSPFDDNLAISSQFETHDELTKLYNGLIKHKLLKQADYKNVIHMCGSGVTACHNILAMEHIGMHGSKLYLGSWSEWITDPQRPVVKR